MISLPKFTPSRVINWHRQKTRSNDRNAHVSFICTICAPYLAHAQSFFSSVLVDSFHEVKIIRAKVDGNWSKGGRGGERNGNKWTELGLPQTLPHHPHPPSLPPIYLCLCLPNRQLDWFCFFLRKLQHHILSSNIWLYINIVATVFTTYTVQVFLIQYNRKPTRPRLQRIRFLKTIIELTFCYYSCNDRMLAGFESRKEIFAISPRQTDLNA